jgi:hypothetical protein
LILYSKNCNESTEHDAKVEKHCQKNFSTPSEQIRLQRIFGIKMIKKNSIFMVVNRVNTNCFESIFDRLIWLFCFLSLPGYVFIYMCLCVLYYNNLYSERNEYKWIEACRYIHIYTEKIENYKINTERYDMQHYCNSGAEISVVTAASSTDFVVLAMYYLKYFVN